MTKEDKKIQQLSKLIPALKKVPEKDRIYVFNQAFKTTGYRVFLALMVLLFILLFYLNLDNILNYNGIESGGIISRNIHFIKELGYVFFLPLMVIFAILVLGRNYFVNREIKKYEKNNETYKNG